MTTLLTIALGAMTADAAEPVFVPSFTYSTQSDFQIAVMVEGMVTDRLLQDGHIVLTSDVVAPVVGASAVEACAVSPACPASVLPALPTRLAVVTRLDRVGGNLVGHVEVWEQTANAAVDVRDVPIVPGNEHLFANEVSVATGAAVARYGPSPDNVLMDAARLIAGQPIGAPPPAAPMPAPVPLAPPAGTTVIVPIQPVAPPPVAPPVAGPPAAFKPPRYDGSTPHEGSIEPILEGTGVAKRHLVGLEPHFRKSGLDPRDWLYKSMSHAGRFTVEIRAGLSLGDNDRYAAMRVATVDGVQTNSFYIEAPAPARRVNGGIYLGYAPAAMIDLGVLAGLQWGERRTTTGIIAADANNQVLAQTISPEQTVEAVQFVMQPRVRGYIVPMGPVKPFLVTGAEFRFFNQYLLDQPANLQYPVPPAGMTPGWVGGGGMLIDPGPILGLFAEGTYTAHFGPRAVASSPAAATPWPYAVPETYAFARYTVTITGGVQFRL